MLSPIFRLAVLCMFLAVAAFAGDDAPISWAVEGPYRASIVEEAVLGLYAPGQLWSTDLLGTCDSLQRQALGGCGAGWVVAGGENDAQRRRPPAPVPLPSGAHGLATALAALVALRRPRG